ncbi:DNA polymerase zeta [Sporothrix curviconia]|uniref:DNA polymerase n=1 Tax=Sporothrix curviconia TaxID=1260050 RepID=A0ABP0BRJ4_9PEZI
MFQVRIHCIDYCLAAPTKADFAASRAPIVRKNSSRETAKGPTKDASEDTRRDTSRDTSNNGSRVSNVSDAAADSREVRVPIIRVFGATASGRIACAHIHGVFPYVFVPFDSFRFEDVDRIIASLRNGINRAVGRTAVLAITFVRGIPFYGFHVGFRPYLKIYLYDPSQMSRVAEMLRQGRIGGVPQLLPQESHIPFLLQFMTDYNLYGCDILEATEKEVSWRAPAPPSPSARNCPLEVDIAAYSICNRHAVPERWQHEDLPEVPNKPNERLVYSMAALWREMAAKYNKKGRKNAEERKAWEMISTQEAFAQLGASSSDPRRTPAAWIHEDEYREQIADIIAAEKRHDTRTPPRESLEDELPTIRQSVEDFYPKSTRSENKKRKRGCTQGHPGGQETAANDNGDSDGDFDFPSSLPKKPRLSDAAALSAVGHPSPSPDFEQQLGSILAKHESAFDKATLSNEWLRSQQSEPRQSQELPTRRKQQNDPKDSHRPLPQTFPVVKSAFTRDADKSSSQTTSQTTSDYENESQSQQLFIPSTPDLELEHLSTPQKTGRNKKQEADVVPGTQADEDRKTPRQSGAVALPGEPKEPFYRVSERVLVLSQPPPTAKDVMLSLGKFGPTEVPRDAFFSNKSDYQKTKHSVLATVNTAPTLPAFDPIHQSDVGVFRRQQDVRPRGTTRSWEFALLPPSQATVEAWLQAEQDQEAAAKEADALQLSSTQQQMTQSQLSQEQRAALRRPKTGLQLDMRTLCLEVHAASRGTFLPNPERDAIQCVFWRCSGGGEIDIYEEVHGLHIGGKNGGVISAKRPLRDDFCVDVAADEKALIQLVIRLVHLLDPDLLAGYEVLGSSWGYLKERAALYDIDLWQELSRVAQPRVVPFHERDQGVTGRYVLSINQAMRADVDLRQYTLESAAWNVLGRRVPFYRPEVLTAWASSGRQTDLSRLMRYYRRRTAVGLALIEATELVSRTSEQARVLGVDFASVLDRGSQFKVESVMLRVAKPENFVMPSPSHEQVGQQNAAECTPLVLEPRSNFYSSPVVVLDFTSLYPSLMIAYNLCYSTYAGRLDPLYHEKKLAVKAAAQERTRVEKDTHHDIGNSDNVGSDHGSSGNTVNCPVVDDETAALLAKHQEKAATKLGFTTYNRPPGLLDRLSQLGLVVSPTGTMYVGARTRQSLLAKMLAELLDTRAMVKAAMKKTAAHKIAERQRLHNRQLALKLLANVTYGYTSASFSGRMPCVEVADSIVQTGRQTLDKAIALIHSVQRWGAEVVYGDTDSLFIHLPGRTREEAFKLGAEMAEAVTATNAHPVRLKFEKVYHPCVLLAKKRYVGYMYDNPQQAEPVFDAKGIETVRRDGSPASAKILEECLRILFDSADLSRVKAYVQARFEDVMSDRLSIADLCFAKEVRAPTSYRAPPPGAVVASRRMAQDPRATLVHGERVPYVVIAGPPDMALRDRCVAPEEMVKNRNLRLDSDYYIQKSLVPPLDRIFRLVGVDVLRWYLEMPKARMPLRTADPAPTQQMAGAGAGSAGGGHVGQQTLDTWLRGSRCARCDMPVRRKRRRWPAWRGGGAQRGVANGGSNGNGNGNGKDADKVRFGQQTSAAAPSSSAKTPVLCKSCARDAPGTLARLQTQARDAERAYREILEGCRSCARLGPREEVRCENLTCPVYFVRTERAVKAKIERAKAPLVAMLARRGMQDLEW